MKLINQVANASFHFIQISKRKNADIFLSYIRLFVLRYVYTLQLIGPISYPGECDLIG